MDWIEGWFGVAPDNGDGTLELVIIATVAAAVVVAVIWRIPRTRTAAVAFSRNLIKYCEDEGKGDQMVRRTRRSSSTRQSVYLVGSSSAPNAYDES